MTHMDNLIVYNGMTAKQLEDAYNVFLSIPDPAAWLQQNRERAAKAEAELNPVKDVSYGKAPIQCLDIYTPPHANNTPVLIDVHGGGWTMGSKNPRALEAKAVNSLGCIYVPIDYGLAPEYSMDQMIDHVRQAISWVYNNIRSYGGDQNQMYIFGNSSGAHLAATALIPGWHSNFSLPETVIKGAMLTSGIYDLEGHSHMQGGAQEFLQLSREDALRASPLHHLPQHALPIILAYGEIEPKQFIIESKDYAKALHKSGKKITLIEVPQAHHFDMINELSNTQGQLLNAASKMLRE